MKIIGAGMSGMLAGQFFRSLRPIILEKQDSLPNNHKALLRFRSDIVSNLTGIEFKKVKVHKMINYRSEHIVAPTLFLNNMYSQKVTGCVSNRSTMSLHTAERFIAPDDFVERLSSGLTIEYGYDAEADVINQKMENKDPIISTIPVMDLAYSLGYEIKHEVKHRPIWTMSFDISNIDCEVYQTVYYPSPKTPFYRMSITGNKVIVEFCIDYESRNFSYDIIDIIMHFLKEDFGILDIVASNIEHSHQKYGKLIECNDKSVKDFIGHATRHHNIYSLGRWATHRQILMDDVVHDLKVIGNMISSNQYKR